MLLFLADTISTSRFYQDLTFARFGHFITFNKSCFKTCCSDQMFFLLPVYCAFLVSLIHWPWTGYFHPEVAFKQDDSALTLVVARYLWQEREWSQGTAAASCCGGLVAAIEVQYCPGQRDHWSYPPGYCYDWHARLGWKTFLSPIGYAALL